MRNSYLETGEMRPEPAAVLNAINSGLLGAQNLVEEGLRLYSRAVNDNQQISNMALADWVRVIEAKDDARLDSESATAANIVIHLTGTAILDLRK